MIDALAVTTNEAREGVDARQLHAALGVGRDFTTWMAEQFERYELVEGQDYSPFSGDRSDGLPGKPRTDYALEVGAAKLIALGTRGPAARAAMAQLVRIEAAWNTPAAVIARGLQMAHAELSRVRSENAILAPKARVYDACMSAEGTLTVGKVAQILARSRPMGEVRLFRFLRTAGIFQHDNRPYQRFIEAGYFVVRETPITIGNSTQIHVQPLVTQSGLEYIERRLVGSDTPQQAFKAAEQARG